MALLGVNVDHVATIRNARGTPFPDPVKAALIAEDHGADGITAHLREDRRHIMDPDMQRFKDSIRTRLNMEMAATDEMVAIALKVKPWMVTLVPERREELTTEGGLDVIRFQETMNRVVDQLQSQDILVSLFIEPDEAQLDASRKSGAKIVEFHTGRYCEAFEQENGVGARTQKELDRLLAAANQAVSAGIEVNAGHGLNYENVTPILKMAGLKELNIGHAIVAEALFCGFGPAVRRMKDLIS